MILELLNLENFRNYKKNKFSFSSNTTLILGPNASGKTNLLEAIYLLSRGKSFRQGLESGMIRNGEEIARIESKISNGSKGIAETQKFNGDAEKKETELEIILTGGYIQGRNVAKKLFKVNGVGRKMGDFLGNLRLCLFRPEDIQLILGTPSLRRDYLDETLSLVDREYYRSLLSYKKGLKQRNRLLDKIREGQAKRTQLEFWDKLLIKNGEVLTKKREEFIEFVNSQWNNEAMKQFNNLTIFYNKSPISQERLEKYAKAELLLGATLVGPHRDDIKLKVKSQKSKVDRDLALFGSRGEQRMAILNLKLAELEFVQEKTGERPVLLLDDIFSEFDQENRKKIAKIISEQQTIITATEESFIDKSFRDKMETIKINK